MAKCPPDCACGRHDSARSRCQSDCTCGRHNGGPRVGKRCEPGCECNRHNVVRDRCSEGCDCSRHNRASMSMECDVCGDPFIGIIGLSKRCSKTCRKKKGSRIHWPHFKQQAQWCAICGSEDGLVGDHNHVTGENRGVLCSRCNSGIGMLGDSPERLLDAYAYLLNYATTTEGVPS